MLQEGVHLLRVELAAERGVAGEVGEQDRDLPALALGLAASATRSGVVAVAASAASASSSLRRWPTATTPSSSRSSAVSLGRTSASISLSRNACSYCPSRARAARPRPPPPSLRSGALAPAGAFYPDPGRAGTTAGPAAAVAESALVPSGSPTIAGKSVRVAFDGGRLTSNAGVLLLADIERRLGIAERLARCLTDPRSPDRVHQVLSAFAPASIARAELKPMCGQAASEMPSAATVLRRKSSLRRSAGTCW